MEENRNLTLQTNEDNLKLTPEINEEKPKLLSPSNGTNLLLLKDFTDLLPQTSSRDRLSSEELQRVATIQLSFEQRIELGN